MKQIEDGDIDNIAGTIEVLAEKLHELTGKEYLFMWGIAGDPNVSGAYLTDGLEWDSACKIAVAAIDLLASNFTKEP